MRRWAPLAAALSVIAVAVVVSLVFGRSDGGTPPRLRLASGAGSDRAVAADAPMATGKVGAASGSSYELAGDLPTGPDEAKAQSLPKAAAPESEVRRLAGALGVSGAPRRVEHAWQVGSVHVDDGAGNPWSMFVGCGPDQPVSSDGSVGVACAGTATTGPGSVSSGSGSSGSAGSVSSGSATTPNSTDVAPPPPAPAPAATPCPAGARCPAPPILTKPELPPVPTRSPADVDAARRVAMRVLGELGLSDAEVTVQPAGEQAFVMADPRVDGLRTWGYATSLQIDADGKVVGGNGYLGRPSSGASYPIISATEAYKKLPELPRPMYLCPANADCPQPAPVKVTGAELGLQLTALADEEAALLPAWLFTVEGWPQPLPQLAIESRFLQLPDEKPVPTGPSQVEPVPPAEPPQSQPNGPRSPFGFDAAYPADEPNVLIVQYGDSGSCPHTNVEPLVKESPDSVVVTLEGDTMSGKRACTDDYRQQLVTLKLQAPLGDRKVVDGSRGEPVVVDRSCTRPMGQPSPPKTCKG